MAGTTTPGQSLCWLDSLFCFVLSSSVRSSLGSGVVSEPLFMYECLPMCVHVCSTFVPSAMDASQQKASHPLELELKMVESLLMCVLGSKPGSSARVALFLPPSPLSSPTCNILDKKPPT